jgi:uncharacterized protein with HEPN domain
MPPVDDIGRIGNIMESARKAVRFAYRRNPADAEADDILFLALIRLLQIIGESAFAISAEFKSRYPDLPWTQIAGMYRRLDRGDLDFDSRLVWETVTAELPPLIKQLQQVLDKESGY